MKPSPKQIVASRFESRDNLVASIIELLADDRDDRTEARLKAARNAQLLRIHEALTEVKDRFGSKEQLVTAIAEKKFSDHRPDQAYVDKLRGYPQKRLLDLYRQVS